MRTLLPILLLTGCDLLRPSPGDDMPYCEDTRTAVAFDEVTPLGFSADDVLVGVPTDETAVLRYADGSSTDLTTGFAPGANAFFVASEAVYPENGGPDIGVICEDRVEIEGTFAFATADGAFAESFASELAATEGAVTLHQELPLDGLDGDFQIEPFVDATDYDDLKAWIDVRFVDGVSSGAVSGQASGGETCAGANCSAWAEGVDVGAWGEAAE